MEASEEGVVAKKVKKVDDGDVVTTGLVRLLLRGGLKERVVTQQRG